MKLTTKKKKLEFIENENGCFECTSHCFGTNGYKKIRVGKQTIGVHRFIYQECFGEIPIGYVVRHKCDNRICVNPEHLELGTTQENTQDRVLRNRSAKGSSHGEAKITEQDVIAIRNLATITSKREIAKMYNISIRMIYKIINNENWKHVKEGCS